MKNLIVLIPILFLSPAVFGQSRCFGLYNSPKGFGVCVSEGRESGECNSYSLFADFYGLISGCSDKPGVRFNFSRTKQMRTWEVDDLDVVFYGGPGVTAGFVRDYEEGYYNQKKTVFTHNYGAVAALSGTIGFRFLFERRISIDLSWTADLGLHLRKDENLDTFQLRFYRNGLFTALYPQVKLEYFF